MFVETEFVILVSRELRCCHSRLLTRYCSVNNQTHASWPQHHWKKSSNIFWRTDIGIMKARLLVRAWMELSPDYDHLGWLLHDAMRLELYRIAKSPTENEASAFWQDTLQSRLPSAEPRREPVRRYLRNTTCKRFQESQRHPRQILQPQAQGCSRRHIASSRSQASRGNADNAEEQVRKAGAAILAAQGRKENMTIIYLMTAVGRNQDVVYAFGAVLVNMY